MAVPVQASSVNPYIIAALISAIPASIGSIAAWKNAHQGRKENSTDHAKVQGHLKSLDGQMGDVTTALTKLDIGLARMDLRFDSIEDKVERHLGWHRAEAEADLPQALQKEYKGDYPIYPPIRPNDLGN